MHMDTKILKILLTIKKNIRSNLAFLMVSKSTPKAGNCVVNTLKFLMDISTTQTAEILMYTLIKLENSVQSLKSDSF